MNSVSLFSAARASRRPARRSTSETAPAPGRPACRGRRSSSQPAARRIAEQTRDRRVVDEVVDVPAGQCAAPAAATRQCTVHPDRCAVDQQIPAPGGGGQRRAARDRAATPGRRSAVARMHRHVSASAGQRRPRPRARRRPRRAPPRAAGQRDAAAVERLQEAGDVAVPAHPSLPRHANRVDGARPACHRDHLVDVIEQR